MNRTLMLAIEGRNDSVNGFDLVLFNLWEAKHARENDLNLVGSEMGEMLDVVEGGGINIPEPVFDVEPSGDSKGTFSRKDYVRFREEFFSRKEMLPLFLPFDNYVLRKCIAEILRDGKVTYFERHDP